MNAVPNRSSVDSRRRAVRARRAAPAPGVARRDVVRVAVVDDRRLRAVGDDGARLVGGAELDAEVVAVAARLGDDLLGAEAALGARDGRGA